MQNNRPAKGCFEEMRQSATTEENSAVQLGNAAKGYPFLFPKEKFFTRVEESSKGELFELRQGETIENLINRVQDSPISGSE